MEKKQYEHRPSRPMHKGPGGPPPGMGGGEKAKDFKGTWKKLIGYCRAHVVFVGIGLICACISTVLTLIGPDKLSDMTNIIASGIMPGAVMDMDKVVNIGLLLIAFYVASFVLSASQNWIMATITQRISRKMRQDISEKINRLPIWYYNRTTTGDVLSRVTNDVDTIGQSFNQSMGTLVSAVVMLFGSLFMMIKTNGIMTLTAVVATIIGFVLMFGIMGKSQKYFRIK